MKNSRVRITNITRKISNRGYFSIGIEHSKVEANIGTLWRSAHILGAQYIFTVGRRYKYQCTDTTSAWRSIPLFHYDDMDSLVRQLPHSCMLIGIEIDDRAHDIKNFVHPERACYILGAEDHGLTNAAIDKCHYLLQLPGDYCMNVAVAGSCVMFDRVQKES